MAESSLQVNVIHPTFNFSATNSMGLLTFLSLFPQFLFMSEEKGLLFALATAFVSGASVFINGFAVSGFEPFLYATLKNSLVAVLLASVFLALGQAKELRSLTRKQWVQLVFIGVIGGSIPFLLFFKGLSMASSGAQASFVYRSLFIFASVFAFVLLKEKISLKTIAGFLIAFGGNMLLLGSAAFSLDAGVMLVLGATVLWAAEHVFSKKMLSQISPRLLALGRMGFGSLFLASFLYATNGFASLHSFTTLHWGWVLVSSVLLFVFVSLWYHGLKRISVHKATAVLALGGLFTALLNIAFLGKALSPCDAAGLLLLCIGVASIVGFSSWLSSIHWLKLMAKKAFAWTA